jgi:hypothetical protein
VEAYKEVTEGMSDLTEDEINALRDIAKLAPDLKEVVEKEKRWKWLFTGSRNILAWVAVVLGGIYMGYEALVKALKHLAGAQG